MRKKYLLMFICVVIIILFTYYSLFYKNIFYQAMIDTLEIWLFKVFPPIFIFYIISSLILSTSLIKIIFFLFSPLKKIIKFQTNEAFTLFIISILIGNPASSNYINQYLNNNKITKKDASTLLYCASFITPLFIFNIYTDILLSTTIYFAHILSNLVLIIFITKDNTYYLKDTRIQKINFFESLSNFPKIILTIAIMMVFCNCISTSLEFLGLPNVFTSFIELGKGSYNLSQLNSIYSIILVNILLAFNGVAIHFQVYTFINDNKLYISYLQGRIIQAILSVIIFIFLYLLINTNFT